MTVDVTTDLPLFQIVVAATPDGGIGRGTVVLCLISNY